MILAVKVVIHGVVKESGLKLKFEGQKMSFMEFGLTLQCDDGF